MFAGIFGAGAAGAPAGPAGGGAPGPANPVTAADISTALFGALPAIPGAPGNLVADPTGLIATPTLANAIITQGAFQSRTSQDALFNIPPALSVYVPDRLKDFLDQTSVLVAGAGGHAHPTDTTRAYLTANRPALPVQAWEAHWRSAVLRALVVADGDAAVL